MRGAVGLEGPVLRTASAIFLVLINRADIRGRMKYGSVDM